MRLLLGGDRLAGDSVGRHTLVASSKSQVAMEGFEGHGAFSWTLLDGMQGKAANAKGQITVNSLVAYVESALPELTYQTDQHQQAYRHTTVPSPWRQTAASLAILIFAGPILVTHTRRIRDLFFFTENRS